MAAGIPLYVCATASVPIAAGLIHLGALPGAALAFLIVGAATNPAAVTTVWKVLGRRTTVVYLVTVGLSAVLCGLVLDALSSWLVHWLPQVASYMPAACAEHHMEQAGLWSNLWSNFWAVVLMAVLLGSKLPAGGAKKACGSAQSGPRAPAFVRLRLLRATAASVDEEMRPGRLVWTGRTYPGIMGNSHKHLEPVILNPCP